MKVRDVDMTPSSPPDGPSEPLLHDDTNPNITTSSHNSFTDVPNLGCIHRVLCISVNILHFIYFSTGIAALSYAIAISCHKPDPQHGIASLLELYALLLITASSLGTLGIYKANCKRVTLVISLRLVPLLVALNGLVALILLFEKASFLRYITEKQHPLFLSDQLLAFLQHHVNTIPVVLLSFAVVEVIRFYILKRLKENLRQYDTERRNEMLRSHARSLMDVNSQQQQQQQRQRRQKYWGKTRRNGQISQNEMEVPLLSDQLESPTDVEGGPLDSSTMSFKPNESLGDSGVSWWEEPNEKSIDEGNDRSTDGGGGWISKVMKKNNRSLSVSKSQCGEDDASSVQFAPIDEQMDTGTSLWNDASDSEGDKLPDISWAKEQGEDV